MSISLKVDKIRNIKPEAQTNPDIEITTID